MRQTTRLARSLFPPLVALAVALLLFSFLRNVGNVPAYILPDLATILRAFPQHAGVLASDTLTTLSEILVGLAIGIVVGIASALLIAWSGTLERAVMPWVALLQNVPTIGVGPLLVVWLGFGFRVKVLIVVTLVYFPIIVTTVAGLKAADPELIDFVRSLGGTKWQVFGKVRIRSALPLFFNGLRVATAVAPIGAIVGEWLGASDGLGYRLLLAQNTFEPDFAFAALIVLALIGTMLYQVVGLLERVLLKWYRAPEQQLVVRETTMAIPRSEGLNVAR